MAKTVIGLFDNFAEAQRVVQDLVDSGFQREDISIVSNDANRERAVANGENVAAEGAGAGAVGGTVLGGALGLLVGAGLLAIPGIGPVLAAGPLAAAIGTTAATVGAGALGAGLGAATGGLLGGLVGAGVPQEEAESYAEGVRRGGTLVSVSAEDAMAGMARDIMRRHGAVDLDERVASWRNSGWSGFDPAAPMSSTPAGDAGIYPSTASTGGAVRPHAATAHQGYDQYDNDYRTHYQQTFASAGYSYDDYRPVYQFGHSLATDQRYSGRDWNAIEPEARTRWEEHNPGTWEQFKETVRYAWDKARGRR